MTAMISTTFQLAKNLPSITLVAFNGSLIALDWYTHKTTNICSKLKLQAEAVDIHHLKSYRNNQDVNVLLDTIAQLKEYFHKQRQVFDIPLDLSLGTPFQQKVWGALLNIPYGQTISYAKLASQVDNPKGFRAVAGANGKNPISLIIPCHRVIASDGSLGGYTGGIEIKQTLLDIEKTKYKL